MHKINSLSSLVTGVLISVFIILDWLSDWKGNEVDTGLNTVSEKYRIFMIVFCGLCRGERTEGT